MVNAALRSAPAVCSLIRVFSAAIPHGVAAPATAASAKTPATLGAARGSRTKAAPSATQAGRVKPRLLAELDALPDQVLAATDAPSLAVGTIQALSPIVFTALDAELPGVTVHPGIGHGPALVQQVHDGLLDAAVITIAEQTNLPRGVQGTLLGISPLILFLPEGAAPRARGSGRRRAGPCCTPRSTCSARRSGPGSPHPAPPHGQAPPSRPRSASPATAGPRLWCRSWSPAGGPARETGSCPPRYRARSRSPCSPGHLGPPS
ncbi:hypothetical protein ABZY14_05525 [Streptomyces sp. NPDC006617]|uniref:hypothetical protein n=1 Tax=Streptomyces sp. NPDC006617 TaxID=3155354 RepID=UPI0033ABFA1B